MRSAAQRVSSWRLEGDRRVVAKVGTGQLTVIVPAAVRTDVTAEVGAGNATLFGREQSGPGLDVGASHTGTPQAGHLDLDLAVGVGQVTVALAPEATYDVRCEVPADAPPPASTTTTTASGSLRCREDPATKQLIDCVPA